MVVAAATVLALPSPAPAFHTIFDFRFDRVTIDGNAFGPFDGSDDFVDEFDDGTIAPPWSILFGTATESGGVVHLQTPGQHVSLTPEIVLDRSDLTGPTVTDGAGDFTATTTWLVDPLAVGDAVSFNLNGPEAIGIGIEHLDAALAAQFGVPEGYTIAQGYALCCGVGPPGGSVEIVATQIDPLDIVEPVIFRLQFDDAANTVTAGVSLDGGASFLTPFGPHAFFQYDTVAGIGIFADPRGAPPTTTTSTTVTTTSATTTTLAAPPCTNGPAATDAKLTLRKLLAPPGDDTLSFKAEAIVPVIPTLDPKSNGVRILLGSAAGGVLLDQVIPGGAYDVGTKTGWKTNRALTAWTYKGPGSATQGIRKVIVKLVAGVTGAVEVRVSGQDGAYAVAPTDVPPTVTIVLDVPEASTGQCLEAGFTAIQPARPSCALSTTGATLTCR